LTSSQRTAVREREAFAAGKDGAKMRTKVWMCILLCLVVFGCASPPQFPEKPVSIEETQSGRRIGYAAGGENMPDYWETIGADGLVKVLEVKTKDGPVVRAQMDKIDTAKCRHLVLMLDGVPFDVMNNAYKRGMFRFFRAPSRLYAPFPSMTWISFAQVFHTRPPAGIEPEYLDRTTGKLVDGMSTYQKPISEPWRPLVDYRAGTMVDAMCYVSPYLAFVHELEQARVRFEKSSKRVMFFYNASSAGMGTKHGEEGFEKVLADLDRFCKEMMMKSPGKLAITMFADHGHSLTPAKRIGLKKFLKSRGFKITKKLSDERDVVIPTFGLVTFAALYSRSPAKVAEALLDLEGMNLVVYPTGESITVRNRDGSARIWQRAGRFRYEPLKGDPLDVEGIVNDLREKKEVDKDGYVADRVFFDATRMHKYPDPLYRIWLCWHGAVKNPPDLVVTFKDDYFWGREGFDFFAKVASTHGNLNFNNSVTFAMSTAGLLPPFMRLCDLRPALEKYFPFPRAK